MVTHYDIGVIIPTIGTSFGLSDWKTNGSISSAVLSLWRFLSVYRKWGSVTMVYGALYMFWE